MTRLFHMDMARCVAIVLVTAFHVHRFVGQPEAVLGALNFWSFAKAGFVGVDVFFVVSGYAMMLTWQRHSSALPLQQAATVFWRERLLRLYPAYIVAMIVWASLIEMEVAPKKPHDLLHFLAHMTFLHSFFNETIFSISGVLWSIAVEVHFYALFPLLVISPKIVRYLAAGSSVAFLIFLSLSGADRILSYPAIWNVFTYLPAFVLGMALTEVHSTKGVRWASWIALSAAIVLVLLGDITGRDMLARIFVGSSVAAACLLLAPRQASGSVLVRAISLIGTASYSMYLYNYIFMVAHPPKSHDVLYFVFWCLFTALFGILMWAAVERPFEVWRRSRHGRPGVVAQTAHQNKPVAG